MQTQNTVQCGRTFSVLTDLIPTTIFEAERTHATLKVRIEWPEMRPQNGRLLSN